MSDVKTEEKIKLATGNYRLTKTVKNPSADRRQKFDWRKAAEWVEGTEFVIKEEDLSRLAGDDIPELRGRTITKMRPVENAGARDLYDNDETFQLIAAALSPCEESLDGLFSRMGVDNHSPAKFLRWAIEQEFIGRRLFEQLYTAWIDDVGITGSSKIFK